MVEIVAEISGNHGGSLERASTLIYEAAKAGCDYAKFQYYRPIDMPDRDEGDNLAMYQRLYVRTDWLPDLFYVAKKCKIGLFASVFSVERAKEILEYDVPYIKLASPNSTELPERTYEEIMWIVPPDVEIVASSDSQYTFQGLCSKVLYCPVGHPPQIGWDDFTEFRKGNYWGFSDHTSGIRTPLAFIRAGADMVEKHLKLEGDNDCIDATFSAEPETMGLLCKLAHNR